MGWTIHPYEMRVDWDFVHPQFKVRPRSVDAHACMYIRSTPGWMDGWMDGSIALPRVGSGRLSRTHPCVHTHPQYNVQTWEMLLVEALTWVMPITEVFLRYKLFGPHAVLTHIYFTSFWLAITLHLNMAGHDDGTPEQEPVNGRYKCNAVSIKPWYLRYHVDLIAELDHVDHHLYPR